jgi:hypothetical protein
LIEGTTIDISSFRSQLLEVNENLEIAQQYLFRKVNVVQKYYHAVDLALKDICIKERESHSA